MIVILNPDELILTDQMAHIATAHIFWLIL